MKTCGLYNSLLTNKDFRSLAEGLQKNYKYQMVYGLSSSQVSYINAALIHDNDRPVLFLASSQQSAKTRAIDMKTLLPGRNVLLFPDIDPVPFGAIAQSREVMVQRLKVLETLLLDGDAVIIAPIESLIRKLMPPEILKCYYMTIKVGQRLDISLISQQFLEQGYERVDMVESPGHFSLRGGILDIFPPTVLNPVRIELFDDEVDSIRGFKVDTQRSLENLKQINILPAKEVIFPSERIKYALPLIKKEYSTEKAMLIKAGKKNAYKRLVERMNEILEKVEIGVMPEGIETLFSFFYPDGVSLLDYLSDNTLVVLEEPSRQRELLNNRYRELAEVHASLLEQGMVLPSQFKNNLTIEELDEILDNFSRIGFSLLPKQSGQRPRNIINFNAKTIHMFKGKTDLLIDEVKTLKEKNYSILVFASTLSRAEKIVEMLKQNDIFARVINNLPKQLVPGEVLISVGILESGFELGAAKLAVITDREIYGQPKRTPIIKTTSLSGKRIEHFTDLKPGDYVVHVNHGIGKYIGIKQLEIGGVKKDYLFIQYAGEDKLYVPTDQINLIQKYLGADGGAVKLYKLGGNEWNKVKQKVKDSVKDLANDLISLYAARQKIPGYKFSPDTVWQKEFEDAFPFEETPDQLRAIDEIKKDMETARPMDRLLCGDVGFGKTEVALRAAFKAVMDNKQVAVLVPTTVLAQQHYNTFTERFNGYPVKIDVLSRFKSAKEQKEIVNNVRKGTTDIIIGTHRLLQKDLVFNDLGLVIVDEEQRFGVIHKERLKQLRQNVDVLTLTATPIPRTLHMSLIGVRDMSILEAPPEDRFPVQTYVLEFNLDIIAEAIRREIDRGGQVYFVHNRVLDIDKTAHLIQSAVPGVRIVVAHGQLSEEQLERRMLDFIAKKYDVLICTTIIETGLDIPNVNTLIVDDADKMGLSQLHQLRGRVGRSHRLAYAYFMYKKDKVISEVAEKRLQAIREYTEFGAGFKIAMRDLEIRGAGNILGPEQHGHLLAVGFDMYCRLLEEAVHELKGTAPEPLPQTTLDFKISAYISDDYIPDSASKIEVYKRIMHIENQKESEDMAEELVDRFGDVPEPVLNLMAIARIKALAVKKEVHSITQDKNLITIKFTEKSNIVAEQLEPLTDTFRPRISFSVTPAFQIMLNIKGYKEPEILNKVELLLSKLTTHP